MPRRTARLTPEQLNEALALLAQPETRTLQQQVDDHNARHAERVAAQSYRHEDTNPRIYVCLTQTAYHNLYTAHATLGYEGNSTHTGIGAYLQALITANPSPTNDWYDARPDVAPHLTEDNRDYKLVMNAGKLPIWHDEDSTEPRLGRKFTARRIEAIRPTIDSLSRAYGISYFNRNTPASRLNSTIEAIGLGYLVPVNPTPHNPHPINPHRHLRKPRNMYTSAIIRDAPGTEKEFHW